MNTVICYLCNRWDTSHCTLERVVSFLGYLSCLQSCKPRNVWVFQTPPVLLTISKSHVSIVDACWFSWAIVILHHSSIIVCTPILRKEDGYVTGILTFKVSKNGDSWGCSKICYFDYGISILICCSLLDTQNSLRQAQIEEVGRLTLTPNGGSGKVTLKKRWWDGSFWKM